MDPGAGRQRRLSGGCGGRAKTLAMNEQIKGSAVKAPDLVAAIRRAARQEQFLDVVSAQEARARFGRHIDLAPLGAEPVPLDAALTRVLAADVIAPIDVPPFDRSNVDGFALRAADTTGASDTAPRRLLLNGEVIVCGHAPALAVAAGTATTIATGGGIPRRGAAGGRTGGTDRGQPRA